MERPTAYSRSRETGLTGTKCLMFMMMIIMAVLMMKICRHRTEMSYNLVTKFLSTT